MKKIADHNLFFVITAAALVFLGLPGWVDAAIINGGTTRCSLSASCSGDRNSVTCSSNEDSALIQISDGAGHQRTGTGSVNGSWSPVYGSNTATCNCEGSQSVSATPRSYVCDPAPSPVDPPVVGPPAGCGACTVTYGACGSNGCGANQQLMTWSCGLGCSGSTCQSNAAACAGGGGGGGCGAWYNPCNPSPAPADPLAGIYYIASPRATRLTSYTQSNDVNGTSYSVPPTGTIAGYAYAMGGNITSISLIIRRNEPPSPSVLFDDWNGSAWTGGAYTIDQSSGLNIIGLNGPNAFWTYSSTPQLANMTAGDAYKIYLQVGDSEGLTSNLMYQDVFFNGPSSVPAPAATPYIPVVQVDIPNYCPLNAPATWASWQFSI